jgi:Cyclin D1 binding domain
MRETMFPHVAPTGDPNVPAGEISFTAAIGRDKRLDPSEYPEIMGVTGRYAGRGLVAQAGFTEPRCGLLLQQTSTAELQLYLVLRELH